jgi:DNA adenine methylase
LIYADPPYLFATRKDIDRYKHEFTNLQHYKFIEAMLRVPGHIIISGYESEFYKPLLEAGWTLERKQVNIGCSAMKNFIGKEHLKERTECLYCSPVE